MARTSFNQLLAVPCLCIIGLGVYCLLMALGEVWSTCIIVLGGYYLFSKRTHSPKTQTPKITQLSSTLSMFTKSYARLPISQFQSLFIALDENDNGNGLNALFDWLANRSGIDTKKQRFLDIMNILEYNGDDFVDKMLTPFINQIKKEFVDSTQRINFVIHFHRFELTNFRKMENDQTGEVLNLLPGRNEYEKWLVRCPKGEEDRWEKEGKKKFDNEKDEIYVNLDTGKIEFPSAHPYAPRNFGIPVDG